MREDYPSFSLYGWSCKLFEKVFKKKKINQVGTMHRYAMHVLINMCAVIIALDLGNFWTDCVTFLLAIADFDSNRTDLSQYKSGVEK